MAPITNVYLKTYFLKRVDFLGVRLIAHLKNRINLGCISDLNSIAYLTIANRRLDLVQLCPDFLEKIIAFR